MKITDTLKAAFAPHLTQQGVYIGNVNGEMYGAQGVYKAMEILRKMGLSVSDKVIVMQFESRAYYGYYNGSSANYFVSSYQFLEKGTEDSAIQNNLATYNPSMDSLVIYYHDGKDRVGRGHDRNLCKSIKTIPE
jgi:hypothetical protein